MVTWPVFLTDMISIQARRARGNHVTNSFLDLRVAQLYHGDRNALLQTRYVLEGAFVCVLPHTSKHL